MLRNIISRPDTPWQGFWKGFGGTLISAGLPVIIGAPLRAGGWRALSISIPIGLAIGVLGGVGLAIWRAVQGWAYREVSGEDD